MRRTLGCPLVREALSARIDGEAQPGESSAAALEAHLTGCLSCREFAAALPELRAELRRAGIHVLPGEGPPSRRPLLLKSARLAPVGAAAVALPLFGLVAFGHVHLERAHRPAPCARPIVLEARQIPQIPGMTRLPLRHQR